MKQLILVIFFSAFTLSANAQHEVNEHLIRDLIDLYRPDAISRFNQDIELNFDPSDMLNATGGHLKDGRIQITVYGGIMKQLNELEIMFVICHELGHIFGEVTFDKLPIGNRSTVHMGINGLEGEADYFAGSCVLESLSKLTHVPNAELEAKTLESIMGTMTKLYGTPVDPGLAENKLFSGINAQYPDKECRALSALRGMRNEARPRCWYNPAP